MKAKWVNIVDSLQGNVDQRHYARRIPGNGEYGAICAKPELSKKTKKAKAEHPTAKRFAEFVIEVANGTQTNNEKNGYHEIAIFKNGVTL